MRKLKLFFTALAVLITSVAFAQTVKVSGVVKDAKTGEPIPFAAVQVKGTMNGVSSNADGVYEINAPQGEVLVFSSIGYETEDVTVTGTKIDVQLVSDAVALDETIVVAYGVQKKSSFVGSAKQLSGDKLEKMSSSNVTKSLEGAVAGLQTASSTGTPGSSASIMIRGIGSVSASTSPLIVVDGVPYEGSLNSIPAQDIESLTVLKDAAANSMYGARGSNGVIIITTKRGQKGKVNITFDAKVGVNSRAVPAYETISNPADYYEMMWEGVRNSYYYTGALDLAQAGIAASANLFKDFLGNDYNVYKNVANSDVINPATGKINPNATELKWTDDWNKDAFQNGIRQEYNISASGGSDRTQAYMSVSYLNDEGYVPESGFSRISVRAKVDHAIGKFIKAGLNLAYSNTVQQTYSSSEGSNYSNLFMFSQMIAPIYPIYLYDNEGNKQYDAQGNVRYDWGETGRAYAPSSNPYGQLMSSQINSTRDNISSRGYVNVNILKDLVFSVNVAYDVFNTKALYYTTPVGGDAANVNGRSEHDVFRYTALNANQLLTWSPTFGAHELNVLVGHETKSDTSYTMWGEMTNVVDINIPDFSNMTVYNYLDSYSSQYFLEGAFARAEYNYANKYYFSGSYRMDGSSRFHPDVRWGNFWAVGASWNAKNESFLNGVGWVNALKLKASYGTQGNDNLLLNGTVLNKVYENLYSISRVDGTAALTQTFRAAPEVTWEKSNNFNVGVEARFLDRLSVNAEYFIKETKDMIYYRPLALSQGSPTTQLVNDMDMVNKGVEFEIGVDIIKKRNIQWNFAINGTHYKNQITRLPADYPEEGKQVDSYWREVGGSLYDYYMYQWMGVNPDNGLPQYYGEKAILDADGKETGEVEEIIVNTTSEAKYRKTGKTSIPDLYGGFSTALNAYGFDFSAQFAYQIGGYTYDSVYAQLMGNGSGDNYHVDIFDRWTPQNRDSNIPRMQNDYQEANAGSDRWLISSSYFSIRNVTLGYTLPTKWANALSLNTLRIYVTGDNLFYTSARKGMDVRKSFSGGNDFTYSALRTISGGITLTF